MLSTYRNQEGEKRMNQMLKPSETITSEVLVHHSHLIPPLDTIRAKTQAGQSSRYALFHHSPACIPCHLIAKHVTMLFRVMSDSVGAGPFSKNLCVSISCADYNYTKLLHGSAISNAKQHSSHVDQTTIDRTSTNEGRNEELPGMTTSALQL